MKRILIALTMLLMLSCTSETTKDGNCGDNVVDPGEDCDGYNIGGFYCQALGYYGGRLTCNENCTFNLAECQGAGNCGDGVVQEYNESCDGADLLDDRCTSIGYPSGTLGCAQNCRFDLSDCQGAEVCGNGVIDAPEQCDGAALGGLSCTDFYDFVGGTLRCASDCRYDFSGCYSQVVCGDGVISGEEACDSENMRGFTCGGLGLGEGELTCVDCQFDATGCEVESLCGDGIVTGNEECDVDAYGGETCKTLGFHDGSLVCNFDCTLNTEVCQYYGRCGDETVQPLYEDCEMNDLGRATCESLGYYGGTLACSAGCTFDLTGCAGFGTCGDGIRNGTEACDGSDLGGATCSSIGAYGTGTVTCSADCTYNAAGCGGICGDGVVQAGYEQCDGSVSGLTCRDFGYISGVITDCRSDCTINAGSCLAVAVVGSADDDYVVGGIMDAQGVMSVVGTVENYPMGKGGGLTLEMFLTRIAPDGSRITTSFGTSDSDKPVGVAQDPVTGEIVVAGHTGGVLGAASLGGQDLFVARFSAAGVLGSVVQLGGADGLDEYATGVVVDTSSNVYVVGHTNGDFDGGGSTDTTDAIIIKLDASGNEVWRRQYNGMDAYGGYSYDYFTAAALDGAGNLYAVGHSNGDLVGDGSPLGSEDLILYKISPDGDTLWVRAAGTEADDWGYAVAVGPQDQVYVGGLTYGSLSGGMPYNDYGAVLLGGFTTDGTPLFITSWDYLYDMGLDQINSLQVLSDGRLIAVGIGADYFLGQFLDISGQIFAAEVDTTDGTSLSVQTYGDDGEFFVTGSFLSPGDSVIATGYTYSSIGGTINPGGPDGFVYTVYVP